MQGAQSAVLCIYVAMICQTENDVFLVLSVQFKVGCFY